MFRNIVPAIFIALIFGPLVPQSLGDIIAIGASRDNTMFEANQANSNGAGSFLFAGRAGINSGLTLHRGLIAFDIAGNIPAGATIDAVSLSLHLSRSPLSTSSVTLHVVNQAWGEAGSNSDSEIPGPGKGFPAEPGDATWQHTFFPGATWNNPGGNINPNSSATQTVGFVAGFFTWSSATMVADVQNWLDNPSTNFGWAILGDESGAARTSKVFDSRENSNPSFRPMLTVTFTPAVKSTVIVPDALTVFRGIQIGGMLEDVFESDDSRMLFNPGFVINSGEAPVWLIFDATLPSDHPGSLEIVVESQVGTPGLTGTLESWNWTLAAYDVVDNFESGFNSDVVVAIDLGPGISDYVQAGTGAVRSRVGWRKTGFTINYPWEVRLDQMVWIVQ